MAGSVRIKGLADLTRKLAAAGALMTEVFRQTIHEAVLFVHSTVPPYPPKPATSTYRRTGLLGRSITTDVKPIGAMFVGIIGTNTRYAPWVISSESVGSRGPQTKSHEEHGWWTLQGVVEKAADRLLEIFHTSLIEILKKL